MKDFKGNLIIQTMFMKGTTDEGVDVDNTSDQYVLPWLEVVKQIAPKQVMIYTIDRETPDLSLRKATHEELDRIVNLILANTNNEEIKPMFGPSGVSIGQRRP